MVNFIGDTLRNLARVFGALHNKDLKKRHTDQIRSLLMLKDNWFTSRDLSKKEVMSNIDQIEECSKNATEEAKQADQLKDIVTKWDQMSLLQTEEEKNSLILQWNQELQTALDEDRTELNDMLNSKHIESIKDEIVQWLNKVEMIANTTKNWLDDHESYKKQCGLLEDITKK